MEHKSGLQKYEADKLALLGMFVLGLFIAYLISAARYGWPRSAAIELTTQIKKRGITSILEQTGMEKFFLVRNPAGRVAGFTIEVFARNKENQRFHIQSASHYYIKGLYTEEQKTFFQTDDHLEEFSWRSNTVTPRGSKVRTLSLSRGGKLTIRQSGRRPKVQFEIGPATLPNTVLDLVFTQMLEDELDKIILDVIQSDGSIVQTIIYRDNSEYSDTAEKKRMYKFRLEIAQRKGLIEEFYLDSNKRISSITLAGRRNYSFQRSSISEILKYFPEKAQYLLNREMELKPEDKFLPQAR